MASAAPPNPCRTRGRRRVVLLVALAGAAAVLAVGVWYGWQGYTMPTLPSIDYGEAEPAVVAAIERARDKVRAAPRSGAAWGFLGKVLQAHGYDHEADPCYAQAERFDSDEPRWPYFQALYRLGHEPEAALPFLERAVERCERREQENSNPRLRLAETLFQLGRHSEAEQHLRCVLERHPNNLRAHYDLALVALDRNENEAALRHLSLVATSPFARQKACAHLAALHLRAGDATAAAEFNRRATEPPPDLPWQDPYLGDFQTLEVGLRSRYVEVERLENAGRNDEAARILWQMTQESPDDRCYTALGIVLAKTGNFANAERALREALRRAPDKIQARYFLGLTLYQQGEQLWDAGEQEQARGRFREAVEHTRRAVELKPDDAFAQLYLGLSLRRLGRRKEGLSSLRDAVRRGPEFPDTHLGLGEALVEDGQKEEAVDQLRAAVRLALPDDPRPRAALEKALGKGAKPG